MKVLLFLASAGLLVVAAAQQSSNAFGKSCASVRHGEVTADMNQCSNYLMCRDGILYLFTCPESFGFNSNSNLCEYKLTCLKEFRNVDRDDQNAPKYCANHPTGSYLPAAGGCRDFYYCYKGNTIVSKCPTGYAFNRAKSSCIPSSLPCANA